MSRKISEFFHKNSKRSIDCIEDSADSMISNHKSLKPTIASLVNRDNVSDAGGPTERASKTANAGNESNMKARKFRSEWMTSFPWLALKTDKSGSEKLMYCSLCTQANLSSKADWVRGISNFKKDTIIRHQNSKLHNESITIIKQQKAIDMVVTKAISTSQQGTIMLMQDVYWLAKENIAIGKAPSIHQNSELKTEGNEILQLPQFYRSATIGWEFVESFSTILQQELLSEVKCSNYYSIAIDETTDITVTKQLICYVKYLSTNGNVYIKFLKLLPLQEGTALHIYETITNFLNQNSLPLQKLIGFSSDGASVMQGVKGGNNVAALLEKDVPHLISIHDPAHRENLIIAEVCKKFKQLGKVDGIARGIYTYVRV